MRRSTPAGLEKNDNVSLNPRENGGYTMPDFGNAFSGLASGRTLTHEELVRAVRFMVAAEYEAVQLYVQLAESTDDELAKRVLMDIADEEIVHAGEFLRLLKELAPREETLYAEGALEVQEMIDNLAGAAKEAIAQPAQAAASSVTETPSLTVGSLIDKG
jgi:hypothetical protein